MAGVWRVGDHKEGIYLVYRDSPPTGGERVAAAIASGRTDVWFPDSIRSRQILSAILVAVDGARAHDALTPVATLRTRVQNALRDGWLEAWHVKVVIPVGAKNEPPPPVPPPPPPPKPKLSFIEIQLMDDDSPPKPVAQRRYRIDLPDGSTREGMTDQNGKASFKDIEEGTATISFPLIHGPEWKE